MLACVFGLYRRAALRDFDKAYVPLYFLKPLAGMALGPLFYLFALAGLMAIQPGGTGAGAGGVKHELLYLGAFVVGFAERFAIRLIDRVTTAVFGAGEAPAAQPTVPPARLSPAARAPAVAKPPAPRPSARGSSIRATVRGPDADDMEDVSATLMRGEKPVAVHGPPPDEGDVFLFGSVVPGAHQVVVSKRQWRQVGEASLEVKHPGEVVDVEVTLEPAEPSEDEGGGT